MYLAASEHDTNKIIKMLASQITAVSQASNMSLQASTAALRASGLSRRPGRHEQQTRGFRFGLWSSYLDPAFQKEIRRRHKLLKHKYSEVVSRQSSWDRQQPVRQPHWTFKSFMYSALRGHDPRPGGRWVNMEELKNASRAENPQKELNTDGFDGLFNRQNTRLIEEFIRQSRGSFNREWISDTSSQFSTTTLPNNEVKSQPIPRKAGSEIADASLEDEYDIDPISNRKVYRKGSKQSFSTEIPVKTFKGYRSQFSKLGEPDGKVLAEELKQYNKPVMYNEPDGQPSVRPDKVKEALDDYDNKHKYEPVMYNEPEGKIVEKPDPVREALRYYEERHPSHNQPAIFNEPDGQLPEKPDLVQEALSDYDSRHKYEPVMYNEPDGKLPEKCDPVQEALKYYDERHPSYDKPHTFNEPDGQVPEKPDPVKEALQDYDQRNLYDQPIILSEPDGQIRQEPDFVKKALEDYDQHHSSYDQPFMFNEPDGQLPKQPDLVADALRDYDRNHEYQPFFYNHPDGHGAQQANEVLVTDASGEVDQTSQRKTSKWVIANDKHDDIDLLRANDIRASSGIIRSAKKETEAEKKRRRNDLEQDFNKSINFQTHSEDEIAAANKVKQSRKLKEDLEIERSELLNHTAHARGKVNAKIAELEAEASADTASRYAQEELTGNFLRDFPEEFNTSWTVEGSTGQDTLIPKHVAGSDDWGYDKTPQGMELSYQNEQENSIQAAEQDYAAQISSREWQSQDSKSVRLETSLDRKHRGQDKLQAEIDPYSKEPQGLETCFADEVAAKAGEKALFVSSYGCGNDKCEETQKDKNKDRKRQRDLVREIRGIYEDKYGEIDCKHRQVPEEVVGTTAATVADIEPNLKVQEPTIYKILAYDPTMQEINVAETTSIVPDLSSALTPAEVLLRLSQPAKFFPHFQPLQAQGYEIASGSGDVLVFRKVRDGSPYMTTQESPISPRKGDSAYIKKHTHDGKQVNPIDGMNHVSQAANFASPTGFVGEPMTLDDLDLDEPLKDQFKSNIDVRREEDVFSGRNTGWQDRDHKKKNPRRLTRKLAIGAVWVAGCSYAIGVVAEFFRTGGADGTGPIGF